MLAVAESRLTGKITVEQLCSSIHLKRDAYYKHRRRHSVREAVEPQVIGLVKKERDIQSRVGTRKLHKKLSYTFQKSDLKVGRDRNFKR
jgi:putative transposase